MNISRRHLLGVAAALPPALLLASCAGTSPATVVAMTGAVLTDVANIVVDLGQLKTLLPTGATDALGKIGNAIGQAEKLLGGLVPGSLVPLSSVQNLFTDLELADSAAQVVLPGNPYLLAIGALLPVIAGVIGMVVPSAASANGMTADQARALLSPLPYTGHIYRGG